MQTSHARKTCFILVLAMTPLAGVGLDLYIPALPIMAKEFQANETLLKLTIFFYMLGYGVGQPFFGTLSDSYGRRLNLLIGTFLYTLFSFAIIFSTQIGLLLALRFLQGMAVSSPGTLRKAILIDIFQGKKLAKTSSAMSMIWALSPILAPVIGGYLTYYLGWQSNFYFCTIYGGLLFFLFLIFLPETNLHKFPFAYKTHVKNYLNAMKHFGFIEAIVCVSSAYSLVVVFNVVGPFIIQNILGYNSITYGHIALFMGVAFLIGSLLNRFLLHHFSENTLLVSAFVYALAVASFFLIGTFFISTNLFIFIIPIFLMAVSAGSIMPNTVAKALGFFPKAAGTASALFGFSFMLVCAFVSLIASFLDTADLIPVALFYFFLMFLSLLFLGFRKFAKT